MRIYSALLALLVLLCGCQSKVNGFDRTQEIGVISREEGSGTRSAFISAFGIETEYAGESYDLTTQRAVITNNTAVMLTTVAADRYAIGYVSLGTLSGNVRPVSIDTILPTAENVKNGSYKAVRRFILVTPSLLSPAAQSFIGFIQSADGRRVTEDMGYIALGDAPQFDRSTAVAGKVVIAGSSSVAPVMERLREAYIRILPEAEIEVQQSDSSTGIAGAADGVYDIGMSSRELRESELRQEIRAVPMAVDAIVVIVNPENPVADLSSRQVMQVFSGELARWEEVTTPE